MTLFQIVGFYTALHLILAPILMLRIGKIRISQDISLGDGGNDALHVRIRTHGNFIENTPLALIGLFALAHFSLSCRGHVERVQGKTLRQKYAAQAAQRQDPLGQINR